MTDANNANWDAGSFKTYDESDSCGIPPNALFCEVSMDAVHFLNFSARELW